MEKEIYWSQTSRSWKVWTRQKSMLGYWMQRKSSRLPKKVKTENSRSQVEQTNCLEEIRFSENPPWYGINPNEEKSAKMIFEENRTGLNCWTQWRMTVEPVTIVGRSKGSTFIVITLNQELHSTCRRNNHSKFHCDVLTWSGEQNTALDVLQESRKDDSWNVDGDRNLSESWTCFTKFTILSKKLPKGYMWSGPQSKQSQDLIICGQKCAQRKGKQQWAVEKPKLDNARKSRGI